MPKTEVDTYIVYPTRHDELIEFNPYEPMMFCLWVVNGHRWGWSIRKNSSNSGYAMNRRGQWIHESRSDGKRKKPRRFSKEEALELAEKFVDKQPHLLRYLKFMEETLDKEKAEA